MTALLAIVLTATPADVARGIEQYDVGEYAKAREALAPLVGALDLSAADLARARTYFAASAFAVKDPAAAHDALVKLFHDAPDATIDPSVFVPEFVAFSDAVRQEVLHQAAPPPTPAPEKPRGAGYTLVPFGLGQFRNGDTVKGALFAGGEALAFVTAVGSFLWLQTNKAAHDGNSIGVGWYDPATVGTARTLNTVYVAAFWTGVALAVAGVAEGVYSSTSD